MVSASLKPIILFLIAALLGALGQYFYKTGAEAGGTSILSWILNYRLILGLVCYVSIMFIFIYAFRIGGALTVLYPVYATTFIWALLIGALFLSESVTVYKIAGTGCIIFGIYLVTR
jgi:drug/metabolite transporter (DMT)-like permease